MAEETETEPSTEEEKGSEEKKEESRSLSQEDINKLIESARKQEKDKLYETISSLRDQVKDLSEDRKKEKEDKEKLTKEAEQKTEQERLAKLSAEDRLAEQLKRFEKQLASEAIEREKLTTQLEEERQQAELERYKSEILSTAGDEILRELVTGTSREEIDASVGRAKAKYQEYFNGAFEKAKGAPGRTINENLSGKLPGPADGDLEEEDLKEMQGLRGLERPNMNTGSMKNREDILKRNRGVSEEYVKHQDELLDKVGNLYRKMHQR